MIAQLERLRLRVLCEGLPRLYPDPNNRQQKNGRRDPPEDRSDTRHTTDVSMRD